jgi:TetR/AcrR family transcriptional regulator, transcriptional repressor for nem operon
MGKGSQTQALLMDLAESAILEKGFGATSIEELISAAGITKSGFFYHFRDKTELARALLVRYLDREEVLLNDLFDRADELHDDPLHAFLIGLKLFAEMMADLPQGHPGCLVAIYCYQERLFDADIVRMNTEAATAWRARFRNHLDLIVAKYPPHDEVDLDALADMVSTIVEGGIIMSKAMKDPKILADQIILFRSYIKLLFTPRA